MLDGGENDSETDIAGMLARGGETMSTTKGSKEGDIATSYGVTAPKATRGGMNGSLRLPHPGRSA